MKFSSKNHIIIKIIGTFVFNIETIVFANAKYEGLKSDSDNKCTSSITI